MTPRLRFWCVKLTQAELSVCCLQEQSPLTSPKTCSYTLRLQSEYFTMKNSEVELQKKKSMLLNTPCQKIKFLDSAWQAEIGGWWLTCWWSKQLRQSPILIQLSWIARAHLKTTGLSSINTSRYYRTRLTCERSSVGSVTTQWQCVCGCERVFVSICTLATGSGCCLLSRPKSAGIGCSTPCDHIRVKRCWKWMDGIIIKL